MIQSSALRKAGRILRNGGVVAYPTEGVYGLGCRPDCLDAVGRILAIKQRDPAMGLILIGSDNHQLARWTSIDLDRANLVTSESTPTTWIVPASPGVPFWIKGDHDGVALRRSGHPTATALCVAAGSALVSTSANRSGRPPARTTYVLRRQFRDLVDLIVPGDCGTAAGPSEIRVYSSNQVIRQGRQ